MDETIYKISESKPVTMSLHEILDSINTILIQIDECFAVSDTNSAIKKTHEGLLLIKEYKDCLG